MTAELLINVTPFETRVARIEDGRAEELYIERECERGLRGNIYKGRVQRVIPGIQAAFVDIGLSKAGFLYVADVAHGKEQRDRLVEAAATSADGEEEPEEAPRRRRHPDISELLEERQQLLVQVSKEPIASKGPRLTSLISLAGRYLVYLPQFDHVGIAHRLEDPGERRRLLELAEKIKPDDGGLIVRTVADGHSEEDLLRDLAFLQRLWDDIVHNMRSAPPGTLLHSDLNLYLRVMRDFVDDEVRKIHIDSREAYDKMKQFAARFMPEVLERIFYYPGDRPLFDLYGVEETLEAALKRRVPLKSGGYIVIEQTEALTVIDVNSGSFIQSRNLEETGFKTNLEAVHELVHQLRFRNLGGIVVIDFIDMQDEENRNRLIEVLKEALRRDKAKSKVVQYSSLGLVEMTRKRTRDSLERILLEDCPHCGGIGKRKSARTICYQLFRDIVAEARAYPAERLLVIAHPEIIDLLLGEESEHVRRLEGFLGKEIALKGDEALPMEEYEVALL
ncbi:MAG: Rne/Rng family ribonuclease [Zetaproteobacteria bacterium]|nr:MAG: Rne/Rng family ribonuclease [Zetaproteobacteria bacterium]